MPRHVFSSDTKSVMCSSKKNPYPPHGRSSEIPKGRGILKVKILEAKFEANLEFPGKGWGGGGWGWGCKTKQLSVGGVWIFSGITQCCHRQ